MPGDSRSGRLGGLPPRGPQAHYLGFLRQPPQLFTANLGEAGTAHWGLSVSSGQGCLRQLICSEAGTGHSFRRGAHTMPH